MKPSNLDRRSFVGLGAAGLTALSLWNVGGRAAPMRFSVTHSAADWQRLLGPQRYHVLREAGTEAPFSSPLLKEHRKGMFACAGCNLPAFSSSTKFDSGTGWPSFWQVLPAATISRSDRSLGFERTEVLCARCEGHLGHVFDDGPRPTGLRYCMNGIALQFHPA